MAAEAGKVLVQRKPILAACQGSLWKLISRGAACLLCSPGPWLGSMGGSLSGSRLGWWWKPQRLDQQGLDLTHLLLELFHWGLCTTVPNPSQGRLSHCLG